MRGTKAGQDGTRRDQNIHSLAPAEEPPAPLPRRQRWHDASGHAWSLKPEMLWQQSTPFCLARMLKKEKRQNTLTNLRDT